MILDSSALVAILRGEGDASQLLATLSSYSSARISAASYVEAGIVIDSSRNPVTSNRLDEFLLEASVSVASLTERQARMARQAYRDFGKGSGHPAKLNFGDCFSYALAVESREPLLYKGDDFTHTGINAA